ncbi:MAG: ribonuclease III [Chloroflexi bacterium]|nr:ribonuclease III [Chloroflexota bacterium]|tara:strand:- start:2126 stop:2875 length:750 start_codon:yes stop_codon:yes gene_type:complete
MNLEEIQSNLNVDFNNINLLESAFTHKSFFVKKNKRIKDYNQRLEFLGDSILDLIISEYLYSKYQDDNEGILTSKRSLLVDESALSKIAKDLNLNDFIRMSKEELDRGGNLRESALADAMEAFIGAVFLDKGYEYVKKFTLNLLKNSLEDLEKLKNYKDSKSMLQELVQAESLDPPKYILSNVSGPSHNPIFKTDLYINNYKISTSEGPKKIISEQRAAEKAIDYINKNNFNSIKTKKSFFKKVLNSFR